MSCLACICNSGNATGPTPSTSTSGASSSAVPAAKKSPGRRTGPSDAARSAVIIDETVQKLGVSGSAAERPAGPPLGGDMVLCEGAVRNGGADLEHQVRAALVGRGGAWRWRATSSSSAPPARPGQRARVAFRAGQPLAAFRFLFLTPANAASLSEGLALNRTAAPAGTGTVSPVRGFSAVRFGVSRAAKGAQAGGAAGAG